MVSRSRSVSRGRRSFKSSQSTPFKKRKRSSTHTSLKLDSTLAEQHVGQLSGASSVFKPALILKKERPKKTVGGIQTLLDNRQFLLESTAGAQKFTPLMIFNCPNQWRNSVANPAYYNSPVAFSEMNPAYGEDVGATTRYSKLNDGTELANDRYALLHANTELFLTNMANNNVYVKVIYCGIKKDQAEHPIDLATRGIQTLGYTATAEQDATAGNAVNAVPGSLTTDDLNIDLTDGPDFKDNFKVIRQYSFNMNAGSEIKINQKIVFNYLGKTEDLVAKNTAGKYYQKGGVVLIIQTYGGVVIDRTGGVANPTIGQSQVAVVLSTRWVFRPVESTGATKTKTLLGANSIAAGATKANVRVDSDDSIMKDAAT